MNQDQIKRTLLQIDEDVEDFHVILSGKKSRRVDGLYKPENREIILHNRNFADDESLVYTAIHEFAHHIDFTRSTVPVKGRVHSRRFHDIFHRLLMRAEELGLYNNIFRRDERFLDLTREIRERFMKVHGETMKEFGLLLMKVRDLCLQTGARFEDYVDRELGLHRYEARQVMRVTEMDIEPEIGYDNMKRVARIADPEVRATAVDALKVGYSPDMVEADMKREKEPNSRLQYLKGERERIEKSIQKMIERLERLEKDIKNLEGGESVNKTGEVT